MGQIWEMGWHRGGRWGGICRVAVSKVARSHQGATLHCGSVGKVASAERAGWQCGGVGTESTVGLVARSHQGATLQCGGEAVRHCGGGEAVGL